MSSDTQPSGSRRIAEFEVAMHRVKVRYELRAQGHGQCCRRIATFDDGSRNQVLLPFTSPRSLSEFLAADRTLAAYGGQCRQMLAAAQARAVADNPATSIRPSVPERFDLYAEVERLDGNANLFEIQETLGAVARYLGLDGYAAVLGRWLEPDRTDLHLLAGVNPVWCMTFIERHWYLNSALLNYVLAHDRPGFDSEIAAATAGQQAMREMTHAFGLRTVVAFPSRLAMDTAVGPYGALLFLGSAEPATGESRARKHATLLRAMAATFIERWAQLIAAERALAARLQRIEQTLIACVAAGKSAAQAAAVLRMSTTAVNNFYRRINVKLGVRSKRAALARAQALGLLSGESLSRPD
jgi:DNA-binding CsgD family transcriptional regulator